MAVRDRAAPGSKRGFLMEFIRKPTQIGAIAPSSKHLARQMLDGPPALPLSQAKIVVEYGPGTGAFTGFIRRRLGPTTRFLAIEINPECVRLVRHRHRGVHVHEGSVADVERFLAAEHLPTSESVDVIVSGLPWASFPESLQTSILSATQRVLKPGGVLVTFGYHVGTMLPAGKRFYKLLPRYFAAVERSEAVWRNVPPAFVVRCVKARVGR